ncbi:unnamed protein product [Oppiella nova]|uniref:ER membrane protein complex subunit 6 n=1 Tax=Oppiella nova TaxID=334625 RepID=A0A7R9QRI7_9ACAR|nr:unnamed protein product [Oppiella nova]CAG2173049.1 unnamed protein product [Oppiella nova]
MTGQTSQSQSQSRGSRREGATGQEGVVAFSPLAMATNHNIIEYCRTSMSALSGSAAGIIGLTSLYGFAFYFLMAIVLWLIIIVNVGNHWTKYFTSRRQILTNGLFGGLTTYVLFWTFLYGMVHILTNGLFGGLTTYVLFWTFLYVKSDQREDQTLEVLNQVIETSQAFRVFADAMTGQTSQSQSRGSRREGATGQEGVVAFSPLAMATNHNIIEYCRTSMSALSGSAAGIIGLTSLYGFAFYFLMAIVLWLIIIVNVGNHWTKYFTSRRQILTNGLFGGLTTYVLFWTFLYGMVHVY